MTLKSDLNFEKIFIFCLKNDMNILVNFNSRSGKFALFCQKYVIIELKKIETSCVVKKLLILSKMT